MELSIPPHGDLSNALADPRMSMSGRLSNDTNGPHWSGGGVTGYSPDGSLHPAGHGRRSSIYRAQNSTLFSAFEEESVGLTELPEEDESDEDGRRTPRSVPVVGGRVAMNHGHERMGSAGQSIGSGRDLTGNGRV